MNQPIEQITVVGAGCLGTQIALQCALFDRPVRLFDIRPEALETSRRAMSDLLQDMVEAQALAADRCDTVLGHVSEVGSLSEAVAECDFVIEAIREEISDKRAMFQQLDELCPAHTILGTNSSSIRISRIESATNRLDRVLNTHFVQPVWKHPFVELMKGSQTSDQTLAAVKDFMTSIGILSVLVRKESTGFVFNRIWRAVKKEALRVVDAGIASHEDVDRTWMIQWETPLGPFALMDAVGLDVVRDIEMVYYGESGDPSDAPPQVLLDKIAAGQLGVKTGQGFYTYPHPNWESPDFLTQDSAS